MATIASLRRERITLQVTSVDRIFLAGDIPKLQSEGQLVRFLLDGGFPIPSPAAPHRPRSQRAAARRSTRGQ
jgi:hypothetical protein